jgi:predicted DNA-binding protein (UPF0251 family)/predicted Fe-Mo cluster-binding NifX family protein
MARPPRCRRIAHNPTATYFKPRGVSMADLSESYLTLEGLEAIRLADLMGLTSEAAAARMDVSRHTFGRILAKARGVVAEALVGGRALCIGGGDYALPDGRPEQAATPAKEMNMDKIAVSAEGPGLDSPVDPRFGRAAGFVVVDLATMQTQYLDNGGSQAMAHGAGIQAARVIAGAGAGVLLTGYVGPKAFAALDAAGIKIGQNLDEMTVAQAVDKYKSGQVAFADTPNKA